MNFTASRYANDMYIERIRLNPEVDDLLDWLEVYPQEPEYEMRNRVVESLMQHLQLLKKKISSVRKIIRKVRNLLSSSVPSVKIERYIRGRIGVDGLSTVMLDVGNIRDFMAYKSSGVEVELEALGINYNCLTQKSRVKRCVELRLERLLSSEVGIELLEYITLEKVCISDKYSLEEIESCISNMFCSQPVF